MNFDEYNSIVSHWIALYVNGGNVTNFDSFRVEYTPNEIKKVIGNKQKQGNERKCFNNAWILLYWIY